MVGYYTLAAGSVSRDDLPPRVAKGLGNYPIPVILLARLAVDRTEQGKGVGAALLKDAIFRAAQAADIVGCRALLVHAKDQAAQAFYSKFDFEPLPGSRTPPLLAHEGHPGQPGGYELSRYLSS